MKTYQKVIILGSALFLSLTGLCCRIVQHVYRESLQMFDNNRQHQHQGAKKGLRYHHHHNHHVNNQKMGISFTREISLSENINLKVSFDDDRCTENDSFGGNKCHYSWGDQVTSTITYYSNETITQDAYMEGVFIVDNKVQWEFSCPLCGQDCVLKMPVLPLEYSLSMPSCSLQPEERTEIITYDLWKNSPSHGLVDVPVTLQGQATFYSGPEKVLATIQVQASIQ